MMYNRRIKFVISTALIGIALTGCAASPFATRSSARHHDNPSLAQANISDDSGAQGSVTENFVAATDDARQAQLALRNGKTSDAIRFAEGAVLAAPHSGENRLILARAYMQDGRFSAASSAYEDARKLTDFQSDNIINYALAKIAEGDRAGAVEWLAGQAGRLSPSDLGLALALAGDHDGALFVLGDAARRGDASAQTRQNLSLALALAGRWAQASLVASQDLPANRVKKRMLEFSALASAPDKATQIASLMGIKRRGDDAMPARLALVNFPKLDNGLSHDHAMVDQDEKFAALPEQALAMSDMSDMAPYATGAATDMTPVAVASGVAVPVSGAASPPLAAASRQASAALTPVVAEALFADLDHGQGSKASAAGAWSVQIGSLNSAASARRYWGELKQQSRIIGNHPASSHRALVGQRAYYRLTLDGMASQRAAQTLCNRLKAENKGCFVRRMTGREQVLWSSNGRGTKLASR